MPQPVMSIGPVRCVRGPVRGIVDVDFDGEVLVLTRYRWPLEVLDRYLLVLPGLTLICAAAAVSVDGRTRRVLLVAGGVVLAVVLLAAGLRLLRDRPVGTRHEVLETDLDLMDPLAETVFPRLVLHAKQGEIVLRGWPWRASQLRRLQRRLAA
ncbi:hypothetical protein BH11ACT8_BH11ACT8_11640 [soil metagenome]